ncbi:MAG: gamma-glutamylcyclotransferase family protein [Acidobacteriota bacterium]
MPYYFAYGNNMSQATMDARLGEGGEGRHFNYVGRARLPNYRLSFTTRTPEWDNEYVGDVQPSEGFAVYGVLYEVKEDVLEGLDPFEPTYLKQAVIVDLFPDDYDFDTMFDPNVEVPRRSATIFMVAPDKKEPEEAPSQKYLARILQAAQERKLPPRYIETLESKRDMSNEEKGLSLVSLRTRDRGVGHFLPLVQVSRTYWNKLGEVKYVLASHQHKSCLAKVQVRDDLHRKGRLCGVDENLRIRLGIPSREPGLELYGACVTLSPAPVKVMPRRFLKARTLILWLDRVYFVDSEKEVSVIDKSVLELLGGEQGDYIKISAYFRDGDHASVKTIHRRAMCGSSGAWSHWPDDSSYPRGGTVHLDEADREALGFPHVDTSTEFREKIKGYPVLVSISLKHLFLRRSYIYSFSWLAAFFGFSLMILEVLKVAEVDISGSWMSIALWLGASSLLPTGLVSFLVLQDLKRKVNP